jgi:hypothetical protein
MDEPTYVEGIELTPVIELTPGTFSTRERTLPSGSGRDLPDEWHRYWLDSLADSGVVGLKPLWPASWLVTTRQLTDGDVVGRILSANVRDWGGLEALSDSENRPVLDGGLALCHNGEVLVAPGCCGDLGNLSEWRGAAAYRQPDWKIVWTGHPWLSVRYDAGRLVFSEPHESDTPTGRWLVRPEELVRAVAAAEVELEDFARRLEPVLEPMGVAEVRRNARRLAGLTA